VTTGLNAGGDQDHLFSRLLILPIEQPNLSEIGYQVGWTALESFLPAAYRFIPKDS
jgi:hypothetical protein